MVVSVQGCTNSTLVLWGATHYIWHIRREWSLSQGDVGEQMERNGGVAKRLSHIKSSVTGTYTEDASVQESLRNLLPMVIPAPTSPFPYLLESVVLAPGSGHLIISFQDVVSLPRVFFMEARKEK
ncbi:hypothetical protein NC651_008786 [Populus alba x Populus x berolinensis]|nr:hypothetical protein NC651_008786 [Populus alba x Populus x berolinensis]